MRNWKLSKKVFVTFYFGNNSYFNLQSYFQLKNSINYWTDERGNMLVSGKLFLVTSEKR